MRTPRLAVALAALSPLALTVVPPMAAGTAAGPAPSPAATPTCFGKPATIVGSGFIRGTAGPDVIVATVPGSEVHAYGGNDRICGAFLVYAGAGADRIVFGKRSTVPELSGGPGDDIIYYLTPDFGYLSGGRGNDILAARHGEQWLIGGDGDDRMTGGRGPDHLFGGDGRDRAGGGYGRDECTAEIEINCED